MAVLVPKPGVLRKLSVSTTGASHLCSWLCFPSDSLHLLKLPVSPWEPSLSTELECHTVSVWISPLCRDKYPQGRYSQVAGERTLSSVSRPVFFSGDPAWGSQDPGWAGVRAPVQSSAMILALSVSSRVSQFGTIDMLSRITLCCQGCPGPCGLARDSLASIHEMPVAPPHKSWPSKLSPGIALQANLPQLTTSDLGKCSPSFFSLNALG